MAWVGIRALAAPRRAVRAACLWLCLINAGCISEPLLDVEEPAPPVVLVPAVQAGIVDQRGRFREIFCALSADHGTDLPDHRPCGQALHQLPGEAPASGRTVNLGRARIGLRLVVVPGLAAQCFGELALPLRFAARHVEQLGYEVSWIDVDGLSSSATNAAEIKAAILGMEEVADRPIVLLGYSKGMSDVLEASADPEVAARVAAIVGLAGAVNGSPLADKAPRALLEALGYVPGLDCDPGDRGALKSLRRSTRIDWLATHRLPAAIPYYSVVSFVEPGKVSFALRQAYEDLSLVDPRNDSQLLVYDQIVAGSRLLGYANADHFAVAVPIVREAWLAKPFFNHNAFPREILLEAILKQVEEDLMAAAGTGTGASTSPPK